MDDARLPHTPMSGRYVLGDQIGAGGMARVHLGRLVAPGFVRVVAIKRLAPGLVEPRFRVMFGDEARVAARIRHPNVVQMLEVVTAGDELLLVMEYIDGVSLGRLIRAAVRAGQRVPVAIAAAVICHMLEGLHAAHEATDGHGAPLGVVHRDVSPDNILVGADGFARVLDFGVAKARSRVEQTQDGAIKGKLAYMAPEQMSGRATRQSDVFSASIVAWECLVGRRLFEGDDLGELIGKVMALAVEPPATVVDGVGARLSEIVMQGLAREPQRRWATARDMALAIEADVALATPVQIGAWVEAMAGGPLAEQRARVRRVEAMQLDADEVAVPAEPAAGAPLMSDARTVVIMRDPTAVTRVRPRRRAAIVAAGLAGLLVAGAGWLAWPAHVEPAVRVALPVIAEPVARPPVIAPVAERAPAPLPVPAAHPMPPPRGHRSAGRARPAVNCDPPYRLGSLGEKIWRKECL